MLWVELDPEQRVAAQRVVDQCVETADNVEPDVYLAAVLHVAVAAYDAVHPRHAMTRTTRQKMVTHTLPDALAWLEARLLVDLTEAQCAEGVPDGDADAGRGGWRRADRAVQHGDLARASSPGPGRDSRGGQPKPRKINRRRHGPTR